MADRLYTEDEVGAIIKRAVELQEQGHAQTYTPGVTEAELERIAREMGISVDFLRKSMAEHGGEKAVPALSKLVFSRTVERVVDGELDPDDFDYIVAELPTNQSPQMQPAQIGRTLKAQVMSGVSSASVNVTARNGRTRIEVNAKPILSTVFGTQAMILGTIFGGAMMGAQHNLPVGLAILTAGFASGIAMLLGGLKSSNKAAEQLADKLVNAVEDRLEETKPKEGLEDRLASAPNIEPDKPLEARERNTEV